MFFKACSHRSTLTLQHQTLNLKHLCVFALPLGSDCPRAEADKKSLNGCTPKLQRQECCEYLYQLFLHHQGHESWWPCLCCPPSKRNALEKASGRDALPPSTGILDRAYLQLRSLRDMEHSTLVVTHRSRYGGPRVQCRRSATIDETLHDCALGPHMGDVPSAAPDLIVWN